MLCTDKYLFHRKLQEKGLRNCHCCLIASGVPIRKEEYGELDFPAILKPRYGSGSRGIFFINNKEELEEAVDGVEYGVDAVMDGSSFRMILLRRKLLTPPPARQAVGYMAVSPRESEESRRLCERVEACLTEVTALLGLQNCLLHADLMTGDGYVFPIELSARPSGHNLHNLFTPMATGVDMAEQYIRSRCGMEYSFVPEKTAKLMIHYFDLEECVVKKVPEPEELKLPEGIVLRAWHCTIRPGDYLEKVTTGHSLMGRGYFILQEEEGLQDKNMAPGTKLIHAASMVLGQFGLE